MSIPMSINLGLSGQPFSGPDIGGFSGEATADLWANWIAIGAFYPFSRAHTIKAVQQKEPWAFGPVVEHTARIAIERRYRLLPYLYTLFHDASVDGMPVMQPVFFADPGDSQLRSEDQAFLLGRDLLVIPAWAHQPALPKGIWRKVSLIDGEAADPYQAALKLRGGAIVPLGKVVQNTNEESLAPLTLLVCLDVHGEAQGALYEDAGEGYGYRRGDYRLTHYRAQQQGNTVRVSIVGREGKRAAAKREVVVQVVTDAGVFTGKGPDGNVAVALRPLH
jgi:alpha-glucosidase